MPNRGIKDEGMYEKLREEGNSKEKAARISNAMAGQGKSDVGRRGGTSRSYEDWSKDDLYARAQELDIEGRADMTKGELIQALRNH